MNHGSLFSGIGGFDLSAEWMGWTNIFHCEINEFCQKVLKYHFPKAISYDDITKTDFTIHRGEIDILTGGFPCQPYSMAGKRKGKEDDRHLWPQMLRAVREIQPRWVVGENVFGLINWSGGLVFHEVQADLEAEGYEVFPYVLPACAKDAPHRRDRVWFVAYSDTNSIGNNRMHRTEGSNNARQQSENKEQQRHGWTSETERHGTSRPTSHTGLQRQEERQQQPMGTDKLCEKRIATDTNGNGQQRSDSEHEKFTSEGREYAQHDIKQNVSADTGHTGLQRSENIRSIRGSRANGNQQPARLFQSAWQDFPTVSPVCQRNDGLSIGLSDITFSKWRNEGIKSLGNSIVPQVVFEIFKAIENYEAL